MKAIELQPLGDVQPDALAGLSSALSESLAVPVRVRKEPLSIDEFYDDYRGQYNSTAILHHLNDVGPLMHEKGSRVSRDDVRLVGVTRHDLFIPILTYVFGEAAVGGTVAVVSYYRFQNELYGLPQNKHLVQERLRKVVVHELGHTLGLVHCVFQQCVMHSASYVEELDLKGHKFCPYCTSSLMKTPSALKSKYLL